MKTKLITRGAMVCALYAILLLINQQTALTIELSAPWLFSLPILIYSAKHGTSVSGVVAISMALMTFLFGSFTTWFYSWMAIVSGYVYGLGLNKKWKHMTNFIILFIFSVIGNAMIIYLWSSLFGYNLVQDFGWMQQYVPTIHIETMIFIFVLVSAMLQALPIHLIALRACISMKIEIARLHSPVEMRSPRWFGFVSLAIGLLFFLSQSVVKLSEGGQVAIQTLFLLDLMVLDYLGVIYFLSLCIINKQRKRIPFSIIGAWIPILQWFWILSGLLDCLLQIRKNYVLRDES